MWKKVLIAIVVILILLSLRISIKIGNSDSENASKHHFGSTLPPILNEILKNDPGNSVINGKHQYPILQINSNTVGDRELAGKTFAEYETSYYKDQYEKQKTELKRTFDQFLELYKKKIEKDKTNDDRLQKMQKLEDDFKNFIESYAEQNADLYLRSYSYHHYGVLIDMINMRIKHLKIHMEEFN
ncbi:MAG: hypothetical protein LBJ96_02350 [Holosporaceae bacterium]|jgi:peptidoglycan hydrolase CwlO-like protein|nr:hypothetical protein [Holosporaceae bacterium]